MMPDPCRWPPNRSRRPPKRRNANGARLKSSSATWSRSPAGTGAISLSLNAGTGKYRDDDPYREFRHLQITGRLLRPAGLKTDAVEVSLLPGNDMSEERRKDYKPVALGSLDAHTDMIRGSIGIPADALPPILQMLIAKEFKFVLLRGSKFRYRSARLTGLRLEMKLDEDDEPEAEGAAG
jgi:hypothetical protein